MWPAAPSIDYVGDDLSLLSALPAAFGAFEVNCLQLEDFLREEFSTNWDRVVLLDLDVSDQQGFAAYEHIHKVNAGVPVILLGRIGSRPLTQAALARLSNAEAIFFKPIDDWEPVIEAAERAFARLSLWRDAIKAAGEYERRRDSGSDQAVATANASA